MKLFKCSGLLLHVFAGSGIYFPNLPVPAPWLGDQGWEILISQQLPHNHGAGAGKEGSPSPNPPVTGLGLGDKDFLAL